MPEAKAVGLLEFPHKYWGAVSPNIYINGLSSKDAGYRCPHIEVTNICMLSFINHLGGHRAWTKEVSKRLIIGEHLHKIECPCGRRLVTSNHKAVKIYNEIVKEQFDIPSMRERLDAMDKLAMICGWPGRKWLA